MGDMRAKLDAIGRGENPLAEKPAQPPCPGIELEEQYSFEDHAGTRHEARNEVVRHCQGCGAPAPSLTEEEIDLLRWGVFRMSIGGVPSYRDEPFEASFARDKKNMADWRALMDRLTTPGGSHAR